MNGTPMSHGAASACASVARFAKTGPKTRGPQIAPLTAPKRTNDIPRARRSGGNISAAAARERRAIEPEAPRSASPAHTRYTAESRQPAETRAHPAAPPTNPPRMTGIRPTRSIRRPAGPTAAAPEARKIAGPRPRMPLIPVTATRVSELSAAASWRAAELQTRQVARRSAFGRTSGLTARVYAAGLRRTRARRRATGGGHTARRGLRLQAARRRRPGGHA